MMPRKTASRKKNLGPNLNNQSLEKNPLARASVGKRIFDAGWWRSLSITRSLPESAAKARGGTLQVVQWPETI